jgi:CYTH domain-containing protein
MSELEIEKKFVLRGAPPAARLEKGTSIEQAYLGQGATELRIRRKGEQTFMTVKSKGGLVRSEWETSIPEWVFTALKADCTEVVTKTRFEVESADGVLEIDEYHGRLDGLWTLECEFADEASARAFEPPAWLGEAIDVTEDGRFKNRALARLESPALLLESL